MVATATKTKSGRAPRTHRCACCAGLRTRIPVLRFSEWDDDDAQIGVTPAPVGSHPSGRAIPRALPSVVPPRAAGELFDPEAAAFVAQRSRRDAGSKCLIWGGPMGRGGYGCGSFRGIRFLAHRLSYYSAHGPIAAGLHVCHRCDNPRCVNVEHLFVGTAQDNMNDMRAKGRGRWHTLLNEGLVADIRRRLADGCSVAQVSRETSIKYGTIFAIKQGRTWSHVKPAPDAGP